MGIPIEGATTIQKKMDLAFAQLDMTAVGSKSDTDSDDSLACFVPKLLLSILLSLPPTCLLLVFVGECGEDKGETGELADDEYEKVSDAGEVVKSLCDEIV